MGENVVGRIHWEACRSCKHYDESYECLCELVIDIEDLDSEGIDLICPHYERMVK